MGKKHKYNKIINALNDISTSINNLQDNSNKIKTSLNNSDAYYFDKPSNSLISINNVNSVPYDLLFGIDHASNILLQNTKQFADGFSANNALLWGARGMGKSSLIKAAHEKICSEKKQNNKRLILIEINREDLSALPLLMRSLAKIEQRFLIFCDDLSFDKNETSYKSLKTVLDGGLEGRPKNVLFYATSNRRHLMAREMIENESSTAINLGEAVEEKVSLSDRFGLSLGFHHCDQETYLRIVENYADHYKIKIEKNELRAKAIEWAATRGARSGRVAIQFVRHIAGEMGKKIDA